MRSIFGWIICTIKGHLWSVDKSVELKGGHKIEWKSCRRCDADLGYRDHP